MPQVYLIVFPYPRVGAAISPGSPESFYLFIFCVFKMFLFIFFWLKAKFILDYKNFGKNYFEIQPHFIIAVDLIINSLFDFPKNVAEFP